MPSHVLPASLLLSCAAMSVTASDVVHPENSASVPPLHGATHMLAQQGHSARNPEGDNSMRKVTRAVSGFDALMVLAPANVRYEVSPQSSITLTGPASALAITVTEVQPAPDGLGASQALVITAKDAYGAQRSVDIVVTGPSPRLIYAGATGNVHVQGVRSPELAAVLKGSGDIKVQGQADQLRVQLMGSGDMDLGNLQTHSAQVTLQGSGDVMLHADEAVTVDLLGSGDVTVKGAPAGRHITQKGAGNVRFD